MLNLDLFITEVTAKVATPSRFDEALGAMPKTPSEAFHQLAHLHGRVVTTKDYDRLMAITEILKTRDQTHGMLLKKANVLKKAFSGGMVIMSHQSSSADASTGTVFI